MTERCERRRPCWYCTREALFADYRAHFDPEMDVNAHLFDLRFEDRAGWRVDPLIHQMRCMMDDVHFRTELHQRTGALEPKQAAADHDGAALAGRVCCNSLRVTQRAEAEDARLQVAILKSDPVEGRNERMTSPCDNQFVIRPLASI